MKHCIFCQIIAGTIPHHSVYEDPHTLAFLDIDPRTPGHTVLVPKVHAERIMDMNERLLEQILPSVARVCERITSVLSPDGFNIGWNDGAAAGQVVPHLHIHIMPRFSEDGGGSQHSIINNPSIESVEDLAKKFATV